MFTQLIVCYLNIDEITSFLKKNLDTSSFNPNPGIKIPQIEQITDLVVKSKKPPFSETYNALWPASCAIPSDRSVKTNPGKHFVV